MLTPEEIAKHAAEALVEVTEDASRLDHRWRVWSGLSGAVHRRGTKAAALKLAEEERAPLRAAVLAAVEKALAAVPVPSGLGERELAAIDGVIMGVRDAAGENQSILLPEQVQTVANALEDLRDDNAHLRRALHDCGQDGSAAQWSAGYAAGVAKALAVVEAMAGEYAPSSQHPWGYCARELARRIESACGPAGEG